MNLFTLKNYKVYISEEAYLLAPFKKIWDRDKTQGKVRALQELGLVYFVCDIRSDYQYIIDEEERIKEVIQGEGLPHDYKPDKEVRDAMDFYKSFRTTAEIFLEGTRVAANNFRNYLINLDLNEEVEGKPKYNVGSVATALKQMPQLITDLNKAEIAVKKERDEEKAIRGGGENLSMYENGI